MKKALFLLMLVSSFARCELPPGFAVGDSIIFYAGSGQVKGEIKTISGNWIELMPKDPRYRVCTHWFNTLVINNITKE